MHIKRSNSARPLAPLLGLAALAALSSVAARPAQAQATVFSDFGPGNSYGTTGFLESTAQSEGATFTVSSPGPLSSITVALSFSLPADAHFYLTDSFAKVGNTGASLDHFTITSVPGNEAAVTGLSTSHPILSTGTTYYLYELETGSESNLFIVNSVNAIGTIFGTGYNAPGTYYMTANQQLPAFSIQVSSAPEPSQSAALGIGALGLGVLTLRARKRRAA